jgi:hypothetical protein
MILYGEKENADRPILQVAMPRSSLIYEPIKRHHHPGKEERDSTFARDNWNLLENFHGNKVNPSFTKRNNVIYSKKADKRGSHETIQNCC